MAQPRPRFTLSCRHALPTAALLAALAASLLHTPPALAKDIRLPPRVESPDQAARRAAFEARDAELTALIDATPAPDAAALISALLDRAALRADYGQLSAALADLNQALDADPDNTPALAARGRLFAEAGRLDLALNDLQALTQAAGADTAEAYREAGRLQLRLRRWDEAETSLRAAIRLDPGDGPAYLALGAVLRNQLRWDQVAKLATIGEDAGIDPGTTSTLHAWAAVGQERYDEALDHATVALAFGGTEREAFALRAIALANLENPGLAQTDAATALAYPGSAALARLAQAVIAEAQNDRDRANQLYDIAAGGIQRETLAVARRLAFFEATGRADEALVDLQYLIEADPTDLTLVRRRADLLQQSGRGGLAVVDLRRLAKANPADHDLAAQLARLESTLGQHGGAVRRFELLDDFPASASDWLAYGISLRAIGRAENAVAAIQTCLEQQNPPREARTELARALRAAGRTDEAIDAYRQASPDDLARNPLPGYELADLFREAHRHEEAIAQYDALADALDNSDPLPDRRMALLPIAQRRLIHSLLVTGQGLDANKAALRLSRLAWSREDTRALRAAVARMLGDADGAYAGVRDLDYYTRDDQGLAAAQAAAWIAATRGHSSKAADLFNAALDAADLTNEDAAAQRHAFLPALLTAAGDDNGVLDATPPLGDATNTILCIAALENRGDPDAAATLAASADVAAVLADDASPWPHWLAGERAARAGDTDAAVEHWTAALSRVAPEDLTGNAAGIIAARLHHAGVLTDRKTITLD